MTTRPDLVLAATRLRERYAAVSGYGLIYGSHASGTNGERSDLDLVLISPARLATADMAALVHDVCALHERYGLPLDDEVDHHVKVHATFADVRRATGFCGFVVLADGAVTVPPVRVEPSFLNSEPFRLRLLFNALSSPHVLVGGAQQTYVRHRTLADASLALLALSIRDEVTVRLTDLVAAVLSAPDGASGKDFLGYGNVQHLTRVLNRGLAVLQEEDVVEVQGEIVVQDRGRRRSAVLARRRRPPP